MNWVNDRQQNSRMSRQIKPQRGSRKRIQGRVQLRGIVGFNSLETLLNQPDQLRDAPIVFFRVSLRTLSQSGQILKIESKQ
jgi:hypothetical protein